MNNSAQVTEFTVNKSVIIANALQLTAQTMNIVKPEQNSMYGSGYQLSCKIKDFDFSNIQRHTKTFFISIFFLLGKMLL